MEAKDILQQDKSLFPSATPSPTSAANTIIVTYPDGPHKRAWMKYTAPKPTHTTETQNDCASKSPLLPSSPRSTGMRVMATIVDVTLLPLCGSRLGGGLNPPILSHHQTQSLNCVVNTSAIYVMQQKSRHQLIFCGEIQKEHAFDTYQKMDRPPC